MNSINKMVMSGLLALVCVFGAGCEVEDEGEREPRDSAVYFFGDGQAREVDKEDLGAVYRYFPDGRGNDNDNTSTVRGYRRGDAFELAFVIQAHAIEYEALSVEERSARLKKEFDVPEYSFDDLWF